MNLFFVETTIRDFRDFLPEFCVWKRHDAKGAYFSWFGLSLCWRKDNPIFLLNEAIKELKKQGKGAVAPEKIR